MDLERFDGTFWQIKCPDRMRSDGAFSSTFLLSCCREFYWRSEKVTSDSPVCWHLRPRDVHEVFLCSSLWGKPKRWDDRHKRRNTKQFICPQHNTLHHIHDRPAVATKILHAKTNGMVKTEKFIQRCTWLSERSKRMRQLELVEKESQKKQLQNAKVKAESTCCLLWLKAAFTTHVVGPSVQRKHTANASTLGASKSGLSILTASHRQTQLWITRHWSINCYLRS